MEHFIDVSTLQSKEVIPGYIAKSIHTGTLTFIYWTVEAGAAIPEHSHMHEQVAHVLKGVFQLTIDGRTQLLEPGIVAVIPPHIKHAGMAITSCELLDVFNPEREDYKF